MRHLKKRAPDRALVREEVQLLVLTLARPRQDRCSIAYLEILQCGGVDALELQALSRARLGSDRQKNKTTSARLSKAHGDLGDNVRPGPHSVCLGSCSGLILDHASLTILPSY